MKKEKILKIPILSAYFFSYNGRDLQQEETEGMYLSLSYSIYFTVQFIFFSFIYCSNVYCLYFTESQKVLIKEELNIDPVSGLPLHHFIFIVKHVFPFRMFFKRISNSVIRPVN